MDAHDGLNLSVPLGIAKQLYLRSALQSPKYIYNCIDIMFKAYITYRKRDH